MLSDTIDGYLDAAKELENISSDRRLAKAIGVTPATVNSWRMRRTWPRDGAMIALARAAGRDPHRALIHLNAWRTDGEARAAYESLARKISGTAAAIAICVGVGFAGASQPAEANTAGTERPLNFQNYKLCALSTEVRGPARRMSVRASGFVR